MFSITDTLLDCRSRIDSSCRQFAMGSVLTGDPRFDNCSFADPNYAREGRVGRREGGREAGREVRREGGREGGRKGGREGGME